MKILHNDLSAYSNSISSVQPLDRAANRFFHFVLGVTEKTELVVALVHQFAEHVSLSEANHVAPKGTTLRHGRRLRL